MISIFKNDLHEGLRFDYEAEKPLKTIQTFAWASSLAKVLYATLLHKHYLCLT